MAVFIAVFAQFKQRVVVTSILEAFKPATRMPNTTLEPYKVEFIEAAMDKGVLLFGEFTLKSGRSVRSSSFHCPIRNPRTAR